MLFVLFSVLIGIYSAIFLLIIINLMIMNYNILSRIEDKEKIRYKKKRNGNKKNIDKADKKTIPVEKSVDENINETVNENINENINENVKENVNINEKEFDNQNTKTSREEFEEIYNEDENKDELKNMEIYNRYNVGSRQENVRRCNRYKRFD